MCDRGGDLMSMGVLKKKRGRGLFVIRGSTLPWDLSQIYPCTPHPCLSAGYERRREWETFLGIISPGEWRLQGDQTLILMRRRPRIRSCSEAASNTLPGFYFISVMETQHSSLLFGSGDGSWRSQGWRGIHNENIVGSFTIEMTPQYQNIQMLPWNSGSDIHMERTCSHAELQLWTSRSQMERASQFWFTQRAPFSPPMWKNFFHTPPN